MDPSMTWFCAESQLPDDPLLHECLLAYASDVGLDDNAFRRHSGPDEPHLPALSTLDHAVGFHTPARVDALLPGEPAGCARARIRARGHVRTGRHSHRVDGARLRYASNRQPRDLAPR